MKDKLTRLLPALAAISAIITLACGVATALTREAHLEDTGETRQAAESTLAGLQALQPATIEDAAFRQALDAAEDQPYMAYAWLFSPGGQILQGNLAVKPGSTAEAMATAETRRIVSILPEGALSDEQRLGLLAASAMQAEGEHNDVFRHLLREIRDADGNLVAWAGLTYDISPWMGGPGLGYRIALLVGLAALGVYWLSLPLWVWLDAHRRGERSWVWAAFVLVGNLVALLAYLLVRVPRTAGAPS